MEVVRKEEGRRDYSDLLSITYDEESSRRTIDWEKENGHNSSIDKYGEDDIIVLNVKYYLRPVKGLDKYFYTPYMYQNYDCSYDYHKYILVRESAGEPWVKKAHTYPSGEFAW
jgi:hypothetical protein